MAKGTGKDKIKSPIGTEGSHGADGESTNTANIKAGKAGLKFGTDGDGQYVKGE